MKGALSEFYIDIGLCFYIPEKNWAVSTFFFEF
jgi:hypothetical protein